MYQIFLATAHAGVVYYAGVTPASESVVEVDTRTLVQTDVSAIPYGIMNPGMAFDPVRDEIWLYSPDTSGELQMYQKSSGRWMVVGYPGVLTTALAFDPIRQSVVSSSVGVGGMYALPSAQFLGDPGIVMSGMDWYDHGGFHVGIEAYTGDLYGWAGVGPAVWLADNPLDTVYGAGSPSAEGLAYDKDLGLFWLFGWAGWQMYGVESESFRVVARVPTIGEYPDGGAGSIDDVPLQTPELLVSGYCPGTVYVTAVDASPGGHVWIASGTVTGPRAVTSGACSGTIAGLRNPRPRYDLVANGVGVASTTIRATAQMCGRLQFQAIDADTCMATSVRSVPGTWVP